MSREKLFTNHNKSGLICILDKCSFYLSTVWAPTQVERTIIIAQENQSGKNKIKHGFVRSSFQCAWKIN